MVCHSKLGFWGDLRKKPVQSKAEGVRLFFQKQSKANKVLAGWCERARWGEVLGGYC